MNTSNTDNKKVDPITIATTWHYIQRVCREMRQTVEKTATNVLVVTLHDLAYGIWDADARVIAIPEGFPPRLISSTFPIKKIKEKFAERIYPGDVFLTNYPIDGAIHLPDWVFIRPIFYKDELIFFTCMGTHVADTGGAQAGSHFLANDSIAEGLNIPLVKVVERGKWKDDVVELILANNRLPEMMKREMASLMGSTEIAERRMIELLDKYNKETVLACLEEMIERTEKAVRAKIAKWPEGTYYSEAHGDDDGATLGVPITLKCSLTIKGGELFFDFTKSDNQVQGMTNAYYHQTQSNTLCATFLFLGKELSDYHNEGSIRPIHIITKKGTIVDCNPGALVAGGPAIIGGLIMESVFSVLSQALPDCAISPYARIISPIIIGFDMKTNGLYIFPSFGVAAGAGAVTGYDGYQCATDIGTLGVVGKTDAEEEMARFPWEIVKYEFRTDSHGAGKWRGSPGIYWEAVNEGSDSKLLGGACTGFHTQALGQQGGGSAPLNQAYVIRDGRKIDITEPHIPIDLKQGDHLVMLSGGGAGIGRPDSRDPEAVKNDVKNELVSLEMAKEKYKVIINPEAMEIEYSATNKIREKNNI